MFDKNLLSFDSIFRCEASFKVKLIGYWSSNEAKELEKDVFFNNWFALRYLYFYFAFTIDDNPSLFFGTCYCYILALLNGTLLNW
jgi:hypothetical protein